MKQRLALRAGDQARNWRFAALGGITAGLALAPVAPARPSVGALAALPLSVAVLAAARPGADTQRSSICWLACVGLVAALTGFLAGGARVHAIDDEALRVRPGTQARIAGFTRAVPRRDNGEVGVIVETGAGRVLVLAPEPVPELPIGTSVSADGVFAPPEPWRAGWLLRQGVAMTLRTERIVQGSARRAGVAGLVDGIRDRAERALERGMGERESSLARGFVLGQDDVIDGRTREEFQRSGLAHLLAVSGQNVVLLCLLAWPFLAVIGLTLRARLIAALCLIAIYVPVTGAGPSIQRAGVMGAAGLVAALADRPRSRWYALLLAAAVTLSINPRTGEDVGWQLSFAAVIGILLWTARLTPALAAGAARGSARGAVAEGVAITVAATLATAPLMAHHFEQLSTSALPANILALPAVAPAMWLGMLAGIAGQVPGIPLDPLNWVNSLCLGYIAQVARWFAGPDWALLPIRLPSIWSVLAAYAALLGGMELALRWLRRRDGLAPPRRRRGQALALATALAAALLVALLPSSRPEATQGAGALVVRVLDVGQGDAILLDPPAGGAVLVDTGPPEADVADRLRQLDVESLAAVAITHDQLDHAGGLSAVLDTVDVDRVIHGTGGADLHAAGLAGGANPLRLARGGEFSSGELRLSVLWPPAEVGYAPGTDPNELSLVLLATWRHFSLLLTGDAEAEVVPLDPGPLDVLKVAHHGSEDPGLEELLDRTAPRLAVVSVGNGNSYGHPAPGTLEALRSHSVATMRTDQLGEIEIDVNGSGWTANAAAR